jgi:hypothetical protein
VLAVLAVLAALAVLAVLAVLALLVRLEPVTLLGLLGRSEVSATWSRTSEEVDPEARPLNLRYRRAAR